jgi:serine/threonine-protein kinase HipA
MTSDGPTTAFVWVWLPDATDPVVAGRIDQDGEVFNFTYGKSYLDRPNAVAISDYELPLQRGEQSPVANLPLAGCLRDASPDAWGRRVILNKKLGQHGNDVDSGQLGELTYMLESGSDRIGALDFQSSATEYIPREHQHATLEELLESAQRVEQGVPLSPELDLALQHGTSIGGARPKALLEDENTKYIAKFSTQTDTYNMVKGEFIAMRLAALCGINVAQVKLTQTMGRDVLLIERFDRIRQRSKWSRLLMQSALTLLKLDDMRARYASYEDLADLIRKDFTKPTDTLEELFARLVFNIICGNNDDHPRNHAAFWDGEAYTLTPAYDICPQNRTGNETTQAMLISDNNNASRLTSCLDNASRFLLGEDAAEQIIREQLDVIHNSWADICDEAQLTEIERKFFWNRQFLNPSIFFGAEDMQPRHPREETS